MGIYSKIIYTDILTFTHETIYLTNDVGCQDTTNNPFNFPLLNKVF